MKVLGDAKAGGKHEVHDTSRLGKQEGQAMGKADEEPLILHDRRLTPEGISKRQSLKL